MQCCCLWRQYCCLWRQHTGTASVYGDSAALRPENAAILADVFGGGGTVGPSVVVGLCSLVQTPAISLRACYAKPGTDGAYVLRAVRASVVQSAP
eukprot:3939431-Rhodomonas_salina.1